MALTLDTFQRFSLGAKRCVIADVDLDSSYPTGGESLTPANLRLGRIDFLIAEPSAGYVFTYDRTNKKLLAYYADNNAAGDSALIQVPDTTDLSAVTNIRIFAIGV